MSYDPDYPVFFVEGGAELEIYKVINNNVASVLDQHNNEVIYVGRGIAYQKKAGDLIDETLIEKRFLLEDANLNDKFKQVLNDIPIQHIELASGIVEYAKVTINKKFNDSIYISLSDHIYTAIQRFLDGFTIRNPMLWDIQRFYESEFEIGLTALDMIEEQFKIRLPDDEAAFIAMHIVDAVMDSDSIENVYEITKVINNITNIVKYFFGMEFDSKSVYYYRFITHIRFFVQRLVMKQVYTENQDDKLYNILKEQYQNAYKCVEKIDRYILKNYDYQISNEEKLYLMIHIERVVYKTSEEDGQVTN